MADWVRYRMPVAGSGVASDPLRPKYDCGGRDVHIFYFLDGTAEVVLPNGYNPTWSSEPDVSPVPKTQPFPVPIGAAQEREWLDAAERQK
jgi:hypothetical protein